MQQYFGALYKKTGKQDLCIGSLGSGALLKGTLAVSILPASQVPAN